VRGSRRSQKNDDDEVDDTMVFQWSVNVSGPR